MASEEKITPTEYLLRTRQIEYDELSLEDKIAFVKDIVKTLKENFIRSEAFLPVSERLKPKLWSNDTMARIDVPIEAPTDFDESTQCTGIFTIAHEVAGGRVEGDWEQWVKYKELLMTNEGWFVYWETNYERNFERRHRTEGDKTVTAYKATYSRFEWLDDTLLGLLITEDPKKARQLFDKLQKLGNEEIERCKTELGRANKNMSKVALALSRLKLPNPF